MITQSCGFDNSNSMKIKICQSIDLWEKAWMLLICNPSTLVACMNRFTCSSSWFVWHNSVVTPNLKSLSYIDFLSSLFFSILKLLTFSSFKAELFCLDWVGKLVMVVENRFPVDTTRTLRLLATGYSYTVRLRHNLRQQQLILSLPSLNF